MSEIEQGWGLGGGIGKGVGGAERRRPGPAAVCLSGLEARGQGGGEVQARTLFLAWPRLPSGCVLVLWEDNALGSPPVLPNTTYPTLVTLSKPNYPPKLTS